VSTPDEVNTLANRARENSRKHEEDPTRPTQGEDLIVKITLYSNGFIVDEGEFREYEGEVNEKFMKEMNDGFVPHEIRDKTRGRKVTVSISDRRRDAYRPPTPPKYVAFSGQGISLNEDPAPTS
jgi:hypothetical protein